MNQSVSMRVFLSLGAFFGLTGVCLGALAAHGLGGRVPPGLIPVFHIGVKYQFYHALALLAVGLLCGFWPGRRLLHWAGGLFTLGIVLFSGSLYVLTLTGIHWLGFVTPTGGSCFILGWALLLLACLRGA